LLFCCSDDHGNLPPPFWFTGRFEKKPLPELRHRIKVNLRTRWVPSMNPWCVPGANCRMSEK
jgi:hypothetical protein